MVDRQGDDVYEYEFEPGMTWEEWIESSYNIDGFTYDVYTKTFLDWEQHRVYDSNNNVVTDQYYVEEGETYYTYNN